MRPESPTQDYQCHYCHGDHAEVAVHDIRDWEYGVDGEYDFLRCHDCGGVQLSPFPTMDDLKKAYDIDYHGYADKDQRGGLFSVLYGLKERLLYRRIAQLAPERADILDVGCGAGDFLLGLQAEGFENLWGIDFNADLMAALADRGINTHAGTYTDFRAAPKSFSLISMNNYLEHTLAPREELAKSLSLLRCGGYLVGEVPGFRSLDQKLFGRYWGGNHVPRHTYQFSPELLARLLTEAGFEQVRVTHELNTSHWALSVQNFMQRKVVNLRRNPQLQHGRGRYYLLLLLAFIPINAIAVALRRSGCIKFYAKKTAGG